MLVCVGIIFCINNVYNKYSKKIKMFVSCFRIKTKPGKTIYSLNGYFDSFSDLNMNLQIGPYFVYK